MAASSATIACQISGADLVKSGCGTLVLGAGFALPPQADLEVDAGVLDLGGTTSQLSTVTLVSGSIINGTLSASVAFDLQSGTVLANLAGPAALNKQGSGTVVLAGTNTYLGGTNALDGTLVAAMAGSLPSAATGTGTVIVAPTLYWSGDGDWTTGQWQLSDGTPTSWVDGSSVVLAAGSQLTLSGLVDVGSISVQGDATVTGGAISLASGSIIVSSGTATIDSELDGGNLMTAGTGTLVLGGTLAYTGVTIVDAGTLDLLSPLAAAPVVAGGQAIGPGALFNASGTSLYSLDPAMFALVGSLFVDQSIGRADMIQILESAVDGGAVTDAALAALEALTLPQNEALLNMPDYVAVLAADVVQGNPANATYQGQPLGNLAAQATDPLRATALDDLVDKWFYGTDLPAVPSLVTYSLVAGPLYGTNPNPALDVPCGTDMAQGGMGDCYLIAALGAIADSSLSAIENMIIPNGVENGVASWTVRFYYWDPVRGYVADYVTVNAIMPGYEGSTVYAHPGPDGSWWMPIVEKAYAEWNETGREGRDGQNSYASLYGGWMDVVDAQVLGSAATTYYPAGDPSAEAAVIDAIQSGEAVTAGIFLYGDPVRFGQLGLVDDHAYEITGYDPVSDTFMLANPWGGYEPAPLTWDDLARIAAAWRWPTRPAPCLRERCLVSGANLQVTCGTGAAYDAALQAVIGERQCLPDAAWLATLAGNGNTNAMEASQDAHARALELVLAESGR